MKKYIGIIIVVLVIVRLIFFVYDHSIDPSGVYVAIKNKHFADTLLVFKDNTYHQRIAARNGAVIWDYNGKWKRELAGINFFGLIIDSDSLYRYEDATLTGELYVKTLWLNFKNDYPEAVRSAQGNDSVFYDRALQWNGMIDLERSKGRKRYVYRLYIDLPEKETQSWDEI